MAEYIEREAAKHVLRERYRIRTHFHDMESAAQLKSVEWEIDDIPAADVRPVVRGKWLKYAPHNSDMMICSECEKYWILDGEQYDFHFCPNCGADMREES